MSIRILFLILFQAIFAKINLHKFQRYFQFKNNKKAVLRKLKDLVNIKCFFVEDRKVYSFEKLEKEDNDYLYDPDSKEVEDPISNNPSQNMKIYYNFCRDLNKKCSDESGGSTFIYEKGDKCIRLAGSVDGDDGENSWNAIEDLDDNYEERTGVFVTLSPGDFCKADETERYSTMLRIYCNKNMKKDKIRLNFDEFDINRCKNLITGEAYAACPKQSFLQFQELVDEHKWIAAVIVIIIGLFLVTMGAKLFKITFMVYFGVIFSIVASLLIFSFFTVETQLQFWLILIIPFVIGALLGCLLLKLVKIAVFIQGALAGYPVGIFVYDLALKYIHWHPDVLYWIFIIVFMIVFGLLAIWLLKLTIIISTSIIGGYLVVRGISFVGGHFPDEAEIRQLIKAKEYDQLDDILTWHSYLYLIGWLILILAGILTQLRLTRGLTREHFLGEENKEYNNVQVKTA